MSSVTLDVSKRAKLSINSSKTCLLTYPCKRLKVESAGHDAGDSSGSTFVCAVCPLQCSSRKDMITHALSFHLQSTEKSLNGANCFMCPDCSLSFLSRRSRSVHLKLVHKVSEPNKFIEAAMSA